MSAFDFSFTPAGPTLRDFMRDDSFVRLLRGPVGSAKSATCCVEIFRRALEQAPAPDGTRKSRWAVVRNTNPQLKTTTIKTWLEWFPEDIFGKFYWGSPYTHRIRLDLGDETRLDLEVIFLPLDSLADIRKLLSLELTGIWVNEAREVAKAILDACTQRVDRFPSTKDGGVGPTWTGVICDTNSPPKEHWWPLMAGDVPPPDWMSEAERRLMVKPDGWRFFAQPPAVLPVKDERGEIIEYKINSDRENAANLRDEYYLRQMAGKSQDYINVYLRNEYGEIFDGDPVYPTFLEHIHVARERLQPVSGLPVFVGLDFGLTPAATFGQVLRGRHLLQRELVATGMGIVRFIPLLKEFMAEHYPGVTDFRFTGDPAGDQRAQTDERTPFDVLGAAGIKCIAATTNDPTLRQGAIDNQLGRMVDGEPAYLISPCCTTIIGGFKGGYQVDARGNAVKNEYSHPHDAEQYRMLGAGAGRVLTRRADPAKASVMQTAFSPRQVSRLQAPAAATKVSFRNLH